MKNENRKKSSKARFFIMIYEKYMFAIGIMGQAVFYIQAFKIFQNRSAQDVSLLGFSFGLLSVSSWMIYGMVIRNRVLLISNVVAVVGALLVVLGILIYGP